VLTQILLKGLKPNQKGWVTNYSLTNLLTQEGHVFPQSPLYYNSGEVIKLTRRDVEPVENVAARSEQAVCPYKGLLHFDCTEERCQVFHGRTKLTDKLIEKLRPGNTEKSRAGNFLAVLGASGSGKSSVVRAGLLYQLKLGRKLSGSNSWQFKIFVQEQNL